MRKQLRMSGSKLGRIWRERESEGTSNREEEGRLFLQTTSTLGFGMVSLDATHPSAVLLSFASLL
jgi:hypothetical protein